MFDAEDLLSSAIRLIVAVASDKINPQDAAIATSRMREMAFEPSVRISLLQAEQAINSNFRLGTKQSWSENRNAWMTVLECLQTSFPKITACARTKLGFGETGIEVQTHRNLLDSSHPETFTTANLNTQHAKRLFVFGAGASFGAGRISPKRPPLGNELFAELQQFSPLWATLPQEAAIEFTERNVKFEPGFAWVEKNSPGLLRPLLNRMGRYFLQFSGDAGSCYARLLDQFKDRIKSDCYATLNYDLLLEEALSRHGTEIGFMASKIGERPVVLKLHGGPIFRPCAEIVGNTYGSAAANTFLIRAMSWHESKKYLDDCLFEAPAISMFAKGKRVIDGPDGIVCMQYDFKRIALSADEIVVIGVRYVAEDSHVWQPIENSNAIVHIVDLNAEVFDNFKDSRVGRQTIFHKGTFEDFVNRLEASQGDFAKIEGERYS